MVGDAVDALNCAGPPEGHEVWGFGGPPAGAIGVEVAELFGDDLFECGGAAGFDVVEDDAVGPAVFDTAHAGHLFHVGVELVEPQSFVAAGFRGDGVDVGEYIAPGQVHNRDGADVGGQVLRGQGVGGLGQSHQCTTPWGGGDPAGVLGQLGLAGQEPSPFGLDDEEA